MGWPLDELEKVGKAVSKIDSEVSIRWALMQCPLHIRHFHLRLCKRSFNVAA
jgi:hypothetical protein